MASNNAITGAVSPYNKTWRTSAATMLNGGEPALARSFLFEVDDIEIGIFKEVAGLELTVATVDIPEGGQNAYVHKAVGRMTWSNITLKRGMTASDALFDWVSRSSGTGYAGKGSKVTRSTAAITAISSTGGRLRAWSIVDAYPVKWRGPEFAAESQSSLEESLEIAHHGFTSKTFS
jgi:phage tail-like protein